MDYLSHAIVLLTNWRFSVCLAVSIVAAVVLANTLSWFSGVAGLALVLLAVGFGALWSGRSQAGIGLFASVEPPLVSRPVAALGFLLIGCVWGGLFSAWLGSNALAFALLAVAPFAAAWARTLLGRPAWRFASLLLVSCSLVAGFAALLALSSAGASSSPNPSIERTAKSTLRVLSSAAHVER